MTSRILDPTRSLTTCLSAYPSFLSVLRFPRCCSLCLASPLCCFSALLRLSSHFSQSFFSSEAKEGPSGFEIEASFLRNSQRLSLVACSSLSVLSWLPSASAPCSASHPPESELALSSLLSSFDSAGSWPRLSRSYVSPLFLPLAVAFVCGQFFSINASVSALII